MYLEIDVAIDVKLFAEFVDELKRKFFVHAIHFSTSPSTDLRITIWGNTFEDIKVGYQEIAVMDKYLKYLISYKTHDMETASHRKDGLIYLRNA